MFATCYKVAVHRKCNLHVVNTWMYAGSTTTILVYMLVRAQFHFHVMAIVLGLIAGVIGFFASWTFFLHMQKGVLSASWTVISLSVAFPVLASMLIWHEHPNPRQAVGLVLISIALLLFGRHEMKADEVNP